MLLHTHVNLSVPTAHHLKSLLSPSFQTHAVLPLPIRRGSIARSAHPPLRHVASPAAGKNAGEGESDEEDLGPASAAALAAAIRRASSASPVRFKRARFEVEPHGDGGLTEPSADFRRLCAEQLELFRLVVSRDAVLSVYVRPAGSYIMDQLELRRVALYPGINVPERDTVALIGNFSISAGLRAAEASLVKQQMEVITEFGAVVLPMVKHPFVVGFLVAELPELHDGHTMNFHTADVQLPPGAFMDTSPDINSYTKFEASDFQTSGDEVNNYSQVVNEWKNSALSISRTLAMAYVMDQKAYLLQQTSWQNNVRMSALVEQIHAPLSNIRALAKMLSVHTKRSEIPYDIVEDILVQGDQLKDALQQIQDAVYLTKANIVRTNEETLKKLQASTHPSRTLSDYGSVPANNSPSIDPVLTLNSDKDDMVMPISPHWLVPLQHQDARPCDLCDLLKDLVDGALPLAYNQQRTIDLNGISHPLCVAVEESALRQALSNLVEGALLRTELGGRVQIYAGEAPAGGTLVVIDDDGPDMQYMEASAAMASKPKTTEEQFKKMHEMMSTLMNKIDTLQGDQVRVSVAVHHRQSTRMPLPKDKDDTKTQSFGAAAPTATSYNLTFPRYEVFEDPQVRAIFPPEQGKVWFAAFYMECTTQQWYHRLQLNHDVPTWANFVKFVNQRLGLPIHWVC